MPTEKPRYSIIVDEELLKKIDDFRFENRYPSRSAATLELIRLGMDALKKELGKFAEESVHFFADDSLTDQSERTIAAEIIREKLLRSLNKEVPHGIAVSIEKFSDRKNAAGEDIVDIEAVIYCEADSHKGIIIGKGGSMLKKISTQARMDMEHFFGCKINLQCWVKVKEDWRYRQGLIHNFGLD